MKNRRTEFASLLLVLLFVVMVLPGVAAPRTHVEEVPIEVAHPEPAPEPTVDKGADGAVRLDGVVQKNRIKVGVDDKLGFTTKSKGKDPLPAVVTHVVANGPVAKRGIVAGDNLISEITNNDGSITLTMEHGGQGMRFTLKAGEMAAAATAAATLASARPLQAVAVNNKLTAGAVQPQIKLVSSVNLSNQHRQFKTIVDVLENHDLGLIIDRSGSMQTRDCPGGMSRWDWCCQEATELAQAAAQASSSIDASVFNNEYQTYQHISPAQIPAIFAENRPVGGTEPAFALEEQLENYFKSSRAKPLTIVIVTDGFPNRPFNIAEILQQESRKIRYQGEVTITFLLISDRMDEMRFRRMLGLASGSSVKNGGFVDIVPFIELEGVGIKQALFQDLREVRQSTDPGRPSHASETAFGPEQGESPPYQSPAQSGITSYPGSANGITNYPIK